MLVTIDDILSHLSYFSCAMCTFRGSFSDKKYVEKLTRGFDHVYAPRQNAV